MTRFKHYLLIITSALMLSFLFSGCALFTEGKKKLNEYCPGLNVNLDGVSWAKTSLKNIYELTYDDKFEKQVETYFTKTENGYGEGNTGDFSNIELNDNAVINKTDHILVKAVQKGKGTAKVIFNETSQRIIIIEYAYDKK